MKKKMMLIFCVLLIGISCISAYAAVKISTSAGVKNTFTTGGVNINLNTTAAGAGERDGKTVVDCNGSVSYIPTIKNCAEECYVRVKILAATDLQDIDITSYLYGISDEWQFKDDYLYYTKPIAHDESVDICKGFKIPEDWDYMRANDLQVSIAADAIQNINFTPDFDSEHPWGDVAIVDSQVDDDYTVNAMTPADGDGSIKVVYANTVDGISINTDDFFKNVKFMPGDKYEDTFTISNNTNKEASILFKSICNDSPLLKIMQMDINNGKTFYKGAVFDDSLTDYRQIVRLKPGESKAIDVTLVLPTEADNAYQVNSEIATWYFAIEQENDKGVKTGDSIALWLLTGICFISAFAILIVTRRSNRNV